MSSNMMEQSKQYYLKHHPEITPNYQSQVLPDYQTNIYDRTQRTTINAGNLAKIVAQMKLGKTPDNNSGKTDIQTILAKMKSDMSKF